MLIMNNLYNVLYNVHKGFKYLIQTIYIFHNESYSICIYEEFICKNR